MGVSGVLRCLRCDWRCSCCVEMAIQSASEEVISRIEPLPVFSIGHEEIPGRVAALQHVVFAAVLELHARELALPRFAQQQQ